MVFVTRRASGADESDPVVAAFREHYCEKAPLNREADGSQADFTLGMTRVVDNAAEWIGEGSQCLVESDTVLRTLVSCNVR